MKKRKNIKINQLMPSHHKYLLSHHTTVFLEGSVKNVPVCLKGTVKASL